MSQEQSHTYAAEVQRAHRTALTVDPQAAWHSSEARLLRAQELGGIGTWEWDHAANRGDVSVSYRRLHGLPEFDEPITREALFAIMHADDHAQFMAAVTRGLTTGDLIETEYRIALPDGSERWVRGVGRAVSDTGVYPATFSAGIVQDITEQKLTQLRLRERDLHLRLALQSYQAGSFEWDIVQNRVVRQVSPLEILPENEAQPDRFEDVLAVVHPADAERFNANIQDPWASAARDYVSEHRYVAKDGAIRWISERGLYDYDPATGKPVRLTGIFIDTTEARENDERLRESEARFRTLAHSLPALIFIADADGANIYSNAQFRDYTGLSERELLGDGWLAIIHPDDRERAAKTWEASWRNQQPYETEYRFRSAAGSYRSFLVRGSPVRDTEGKIQQWVGTCNDIQDAVELREALARSRAELERANAALEAQVAARTSELVRSNRTLQAEIKRREAAQAALIQGQKLEALGQLASGIAHDFNNMLAAISGGLNLIERRVSDEHVLMLIGHSKDAAFKGAKLVKQMLSFARQEVLEPTAVDLATLTADALPLIRQAIPGNVINIDVPDGLPRIMVDPVLLETALLNLSVNARDAMPGGGELSITASLSAPDSRDHPAELTASPAVAIAVRDNGSGMPPEVVQRVTEPFFTTKPTGAGTGLGLAMVYGFVTQSGGAMRIKSRPGKGTTVTLYLPTAIDGTVPVAELLDAADDAPLIGAGKVLLVDDDPGVRAVTSAQLRDLGFSVTEAGGYEEALALCGDDSDFDCIVSDVVMPGGDGIALAAAIRAQRADLPIVFMTGRADSDRVSGETVIQKPFRLGELVNLVSDAIGRPAQEAATIEKIAAQCRSQCIADMLRHWRDGKIVGKAPIFAGFDPDICTEPHKLAVIKADTGQLPIAFEFIEAGADLEEMFGRPLQGTQLDVRGTSGFGSMEESYRRCVKTQLPVFDYMRMNFGDGSPERFERIILPYSIDGRRVDRLVSIIVFAADAREEDHRNERIA